MILVERESPAQKAEGADDAQTKVPFSYVTWADARDRKETTNAAATKVFILMFLVNDSKSKILKDAGNM